MSTISASTTSTTGFKVTSDTTGTLVFQTGASPTTAMSISSSQIISFTNPPTATGAGGVSSNTVYGTSALASNTSGANITAIGYQAGYSNTTGTITVLGYQAAYANTTGTAIVSIGNSSLLANTTGTENTAVGQATMINNTTGSSNVAVGRSALLGNTTADNNVAVGYQAAYSNQTGTSIVAVGSLSMYNNTASYNVAVGPAAMYANTTGTNNVAIGPSATYACMRYNTTGSYNTAVGAGALAFNTTASNNTAVGYQAGYSGTTASDSTYVGLLAGYNATTGTRNTLVGFYTGSAITTGTFNNFFGTQAGQAVTTGGKTTIIGSYSGNQYGLDIRTGNNNVVLSDGDGYPMAFLQYTGYTYLGSGQRGADGGVILMGTATSGQGPAIVGSIGPHGSRSDRWYAGSNSFVKGGTTYDTYTVMAGGSGGVNLTSGATAWTSASDERLKDIIEPITGAAAKVSTLRAVIGKYKDDAEEKRRPFLIAQDVQAVLPEAVVEGRNSKDDETEYLQLAYTEVIPLLVAAIKEQQDIIETLTNRITALEAK